MEGSEARFGLPGDHGLISQLGMKVTVTGFWVPSAMLVLSGGYYGDGDGGGCREPIWGGLCKMEIG